MKKWVFYIVVLLVFLNSVLAEDQIFKSGDDVDIHHSCYYQNSWCDVSTSCNITVINPSNVIIANNQPMIYNPSYFNYDLGVLNETGVYQASMVCSSYGLSGFEDFKFLITKTGASLSSYNITLYIIGIVGILAFIILCFVLMNKLSLNVDGDSADKKNLLSITFNNVLKGILVNLSLVSSYVLLAFVRFILETQSVGMDFLMKVFDYFMIFYMYFIGGFIMFTIIFLIYSFVANKKIVKDVQEALEE